jgi:phosphoribosylanthranilate isomerase
MPDTRVKICGVTRPGDVDACAEAGVAYIGFNFFGKSPRHVAPDDAAALALRGPADLAKVALVVDADDAALDAIVARVPLDMLQLHGAETPDRVAEIRSRHGLPVMKAIGIATSDDLGKIDQYHAVADQLLIDAKPPKDAVLPGGNGLRFDWRLLQGRKHWHKPWMLAGGLTVADVAEAVRLTGARQLDVASGVEREPGVKDAALIRAFVAAAQSA